MRLLLYGEYWPGTHVDSIGRVLQQNAIEYKIFDFYKILFRSSGGRLVNKIARTLFFSKREALINQLLIEEIDAYKPDALLISKGINIYPETLQVFQKKSIKILNWNPDDFFNKKNSSQHLLHSLNLYDIVFSARKHLFDEYKAAGFKRLEYLEWYYLPWFHKKADGNTRIKRKVTFTGTWSPRRESIIKNISKDFEIEIWGSGWNFSSITRQKNIQVQKQILSQDKFPQIMSESLVNLNILTTENRDLTNLKLFEITASNGLLLSEYNDFSQTILHRNKHCFYYNMQQPDSLNNALTDIFDKIPLQDVLNIRAYGYMHIYNNNNSITDRVQEILTVINTL